MRAPRCLLLSALIMLSGLCACRHKARVEDRLAELQRAFPTQEEHLAVNAALAAVRSNDFAGSVVVLESIRRTPGATAQQLMATQSAVQGISKLV